LPNQTKLTPLETSGADESTIKYDVEYGLVAFKFKFFFGLV
jgi:hypothetical protein